MRSGRPDLLVTHKKASLSENLGNVNISVKGFYPQHRENHEESTIRGRHSGTYGLYKH